MAPKDGKELVDKINGALLMRCCRLGSNVKIKSPKSEKYIVKK